MTSKSNKKAPKKASTATKKTTAPKKKAPAKKQATKSATPKPKVISTRPEDQGRVAEPTPQRFVDAEKFIGEVVRANTVKSASVRRRMLAWFKVKK
jgi:hypothetical protein